VLYITHLYIILKTEFIKGHKDEASAYPNVLKINKSGEEND